jgi:hypothetical protein
MNDTRKEKLAELVDKVMAQSELEEMVLFKWVSHGAELRGTPFIPLTEIRLHMIVRHAGNIWYNALAPVVYEHHGVPVMRMQDHDVVRVTNGPRQSTIQDIKFVRDEETTQVAPFTGKWDLKDIDTVRMRDVGTISDLLTHVPVLPAVTMTMPDMYKITQYKTRLVPNFCESLIDTILHGRDKSEVPSESALIGAFEAYDGFWDDTVGGYVFPFEYITRGGVSVVPAKLMKALKPVVRRIPLKRLLSDAYDMHWRSELLKEIQNDGTNWNLAPDFEELEFDLTDYAEYGDNGGREVRPADGGISR